MARFFRRSEVAFSLLTVGGMRTQRWRVLIVDDHAASRAAVAEAVGAQGGAVVGNGSRVEDAVRLVDKHRRMCCSSRWGCLTVTASRRPPGDGGAAVPNRAVDEPCRSPTWRRAPSTQASGASSSNRSGRRSSRRPSTWLSALPRSRSRAPGERNAEKTFESAQARGPRKRAPHDPARDQRTGSLPARPEDGHGYEEADVRGGAGPPAHGRDEPTPPCTLALGLAGGPGRCLQVGSGLVISGVCVAVIVGTTEGPLGHGDCSAQQKRAPRQAPRVSASRTNGTGSDEGRHRSTGNEGDGHAELLVQGLFKTTAAAASARPGIGFLPSSAPRRRHGQGRRSSLALGHHGDQRSVTP